MEDKIHIIRELETTYPYGPKIQVGFMSPLGWYVNRHNLLSELSSKLQGKPMAKEKDEQITEVIQEYLLVLEPSWIKFRRKLILPKLLTNLVVIGLYIYFNYIVGSWIEGVSGLEEKIFYILGWVSSNGVIFLSGVPLFAIEIVRLFWINQLRIEVKAS